METSDGEFVAQLCRIKAFQPSSEYKNYLRREKKDNKTRNDIGKERAEILSADDGWNTLIQLLNSNVCYGDQKVVFELSDKPDDNSELCNKDRDIYFSSSSQTIKFPKLKYDLQNGCTETLSIMVSPCISEEVHTKIVTRPTLLCTDEKFLKSSNEVNKFFKETTSFTDEIFDVIKNFYLNRVQNNNVPISLTHYCDADLFVIGFKKFKQWIELTINNEKDQILDCANNDAYVRMGREVLGKLKRKGEEYKWFSRSRYNIKAVYGIYGIENYCKVLGIADSDPGIITGDLTQEISSIIDSKSNGKIQIKTRHSKGAKSLFGLKGESHAKL